MMAYKDELTSTPRIKLSDTHDWPSPTKRASSAWPVRNLTANPDAQTPQTAWKSAAWNKEVSVDRVAWTLPDLHVRG